MFWRTGLSYSDFHLEYQRQTRNTSCRREGGRVGGKEAGGEGGGEGGGPESASLGGVEFRRLRVKFAECY